jgi:hypothetical protein
VAKDTTNGVCSITTPVSTYTDVSWTNADAKVMNAGSTFSVTINDSKLDAQNGSKDGRTNALSGTLTANGKAIHVPSVLDPAYDQAAFDKSYACTPNMVVVQSDDDCSLYDQLGPAAARLLIQTAGAAAGRVNSDKSCGFNAWLVKLSPTNVVGNDGQMGSMTWHIDGCDVGSADRSDYSTDCLGGVDSIQGTMSVSATRTVTGQRQVILGLVDSITPMSPDAVTIAFDGVQLSELAAWHTEAGASAPVGKLTFHDGVITGTVQPVTAERKSAPGTYDVATPVAKFTTLSIGPAHATLVAGGKTFNLNIGGAMLNAMNGHWQGQGNTLTGSIVLDGRTLSLGTLPLNPSFAQTSFDASYACTTDMMSVVPPQ